jgi:hypothetical protein
MSYDAEVEETAEILKGLPGGPELLAWFGGVPNFGDAEVLGLNLDRAGHSQLRILAISYAGGRDSGGFFKRLVITFDLADMIDVAIEGFSHQNVIEGLKLRRAPAKPVHPSLLGLGMGDGDFEIELEPCAGAFGKIRASVISVSFEPAPSGS